MRTLGLIGGMSWESSQHYYRIVNQEVRARLGGLHSARCLMYSFDFHDVEVLQSAGRWDEAGQALAEVAARLEGAGADGLVLCTNTMHKLAGAIEARVTVPLLHIADATAAAVVAAGVSRVALLGTRFTMEEDFYRGRLEERFGLEVRVPDAAGRALVDRVIYDELVVGIVRDESRERYRGIIEGLVRDGAGAVILGCTEIGLLVGQDDSAVPVFDTTDIHARAAVTWMLED
jgi:aspartate racemase